MNATLIFDHFPTLTEVQKEQFKKLGPLYEEWNAQINVVSRKDIDQLYERHVLHSLGLAKIMGFQPGSKVLDIGTGGGFPGIPLAILFPDSHFHLVDSIGKKIKVVKEVAASIGLQNLTAEHERAENVEGQFDFITSRAVTALPKMLPWVQGKIKKEHKNALQNGLLLLKGGDLNEEMKAVKNAHERFKLSQYFDSEFFETKEVIWVGIR